jgi:hypothetical protein
VVLFQDLSALLGRKEKITALVKLDIRLISIDF